MIRVELSPFEKRDLIEYLRYAINQKEINKPDYGDLRRFDTTDYDIMRIEQLIDIIENPERKINIYKPVASETLGKEDKARIRYQKKKEQEQKEQLKDLIEIL